MAEHHFDRIDGVAPKPKRRNPEEWAGTARKAIGVAALLGGLAAFAVVVFGPAVVTWNLGTIYAWHFIAGLPGLLAGLGVHALVRRQLNRRLEAALASSAPRREEVMGPTWLVILVSIAVGILILISLKFMPAPRI